MRYGFETGIAALVLCASLLAASGAAAPAAPVQNPEDCVTIDPSTVATGNVAGDWKVVQDNTTVLDFGPDAQGAQRAVDVIQHYHFTRQCFMRHANPAMMYWKNGVAVPPGNMAGQDCIALNPATVQAQFNAGRWKVMDGTTWLLDYNQDQGGAEEAVKIIRTYSLNRECFVARPHVTMQYWLAE